MLLTLRVMEQDPICLSSFIFKSAAAAASAAAEEEEDESTDEEKVLLFFLGRLFCAILKEADSPNWFDILLPSLLWP